MAATVHIAMATDEQFAMPTTVALRSLVETADPGRELVVHVVCTGVSETSWERLQSACDRPDTRVHRIDADIQRLSTLPATKYISATTYYRLALPELLDLDRVLYLDGDVLVRSDICVLHDLDLGGTSTAAARDQDLWYVSSGRPEGILRWRELGLSPYAANFNAGVLLVSLDAWRAERVAERALEYLESLDDVRHQDQDALNVALSEHFTLLDPRWNAQHVLADPWWPPRPADGEPAPPFDARMVRALRRDPWIVHFTTKAKPWLASCRNPFQGEWLDVLARTDWAHLRPDVASAPRRLLRRARWHARSLQHRARLARRP